MQEQKVADLKPYPKNAKKHPDKQVEQVANSIKAFGFNQPIVVDKDNVIIVGHGRWMAAQLLGLETAPTLTVDLTEEEANSYRLADNKLNESDWDMDLVMEELSDLSLDMQKLTGFEDGLGDFEPVGLEEQGKLDEKNPTVCPECGYEW